MAFRPYQDLNHLLDPVPFPDLLLLRQRFPRPRIDDVAETVTILLDAYQASAPIAPGSRIAIAVGSRGIASLALIVRTLVARLRQRGADPFIIPAMGSHGGATPEGQLAVLESLGISEVDIGAPIISSLEVDQLGSLPNGLPVYIDRAAHNADAIIVLNREKPHTDFSAPIESGLSKMVAIGLGKHQGALTVHSWGLHGLTVQLPEVAKYVVAHAPILFGLAVVENAYDEVAEIALLPPSGIGDEQEREMARHAQDLMPRLPWDTLDVLIIDEMGKNISGAGMDPNIIGRMRWGPQKKTAVDVTAIAVLDLTAPSHGNAIGLGLADFTTAHLFEQIDSEAWYINALTAGVIALNGGKLPMVLQTERAAVAAAIRSCGRPDLEQVRLARIKSTLQLEYILASPVCLHSLRTDCDVETLGVLQPFSGASDGKITSFAHYLSAVGQA